MHCPKCLAEYREGFTKCADCGATLLPGPAPTEDRSDGAPRSFYDEEDERLYGRTFPAFESEASGEAREVLRSFQEATRADGRVAGDEPPARPQSDAWAEANERVWGTDSQP